MPAAEEQVNIQTIKNITKEISEELEKQIQIYKNNHQKLKNKLKNESVLQNNEVNDLKKEFFLNKEKNEQLIKEREEINVLLNKEKSEMESYEKENAELKNQNFQIEENEKFLKETLRDLENRLFTVNKKIEVQEIKNKEKENSLKGEVELFKKYFGINIIPLRENSLKIVYSHVCADNTDFECYIIIEFGNGGSKVTEVFPQIYSVEEVNNIFSNSIDFYKFLKNIRDEFKRVNTDQSI